jgi:lysophospholipase L1-like esterase
VETSPAPTASSTVETPEFRELKARLARQIQALKERGTRVVLLRLPAGDLASVNQLASLSLSAALASELQVPRVDLTAECARRGELLTYTDGLHLTPASANSVSRLLATLLAELPRSPSPSGG